MPPPPQVKVSDLTLKNGNGLLQSYSKGTFIVTKTNEVIKDFKGFIVNSNCKITSLISHETNVLSDYVQDTAGTFAAGTTIVALPGVVFNAITLGGGSVTLILK
jgi:hypothetical protein